MMEESQNQNNENLNPQQESSPLENNETPKPSVEKEDTVNRPVHKNKPAGGKNNRTLLWVIIALAAVILGLGIWFFIASNSQKEEFESREQLLQQQIEEANSLKAQAELDLMQRELMADYDTLNTRFATIENARQIIVDDSVKMELQRKYEEARLKIEKLQQELKNQKNLNAQEIQRLKAEISTLREILKHYVEEIDRLNQENEQLRNDNEKYKSNIEQLTSKNKQISEQNKVYEERISRAEILNVTGVSIMPLNKKGKEEKKVSKSKQLMVRFTIPKNISTPVGEKTFYLRIISPSGQLLGNGGTFSFEGSSVPYTAKKVVEYGGEEIGGVTIYWDVNTALTPGQYTVELFADNYRLTNSIFELK